MQITDMLNQYNRNIANGVEISGGTQGIRQIVSSLQEMAVGNVFEGSVNSLEDGVVTLGLSDGKTIQAKLDSGVSVRVGESMFFQVKSNSGAQIAIRPFANGAATNPTLLSALEAANLQVNAKNLTMVNTMMEQSMSIDKQSLMNMAKLIMGNNGMDVASMVQMAKLGIPVNSEMAAQFENYKSDQYAILNQLESVMEMLPEQLASGKLSQNELLDLNQQMLKVFLGDGQQAESGKLLINTASQGTESTVQMPEQPGIPSQNPEQTEALTQNGKPVRSVLQNIEWTTESTETIQQNQAESGNGQAVTISKSEEAIQMMPQTAEQTITVPQSEKSTQMAHQLTEQTATISQSVEISEMVPQNAGQAEALHQSTESAGIVPQNPELLTATSENSATANAIMQKLAAALGMEIIEPQLQTLQQEIANGKLSRETLQFLEQAFFNKNPITRQALSELVTTKEYRTLIRNLMEQEWLLKPRELETEHKVKELYNRLEQQLSRVEKVLKDFGQGTPQLTDTAANVRSNIQFMTHLNQTYAYVQLPLKLAGQNAHSDLYVYTDKRKVQERDGELTAFLHLDLDHLGSTDVSIKLHQKKVTTNFYLADDTSYQLILEHMDILEKRLEEKGYYAKIQVINQEEKVNFVEDLLKQGAPSAGGMVHRYSFDVRA